MECNCRWTETVLALVVLVFALFVSASWSKWVVVVAAVLLLLHGWTCKNCCKMDSKKSRK